MVLQLLAASTEKSILNTVDEDNNTPLHVASEQGHTKVVRILLQHGSDATQKNRLFLTPVACAAISGHYDVIGLLLENGAEIDPIDRNSVRGRNDLIKTQEHLILFSSAFVAAHAPPPCGTQRPRSRRQVPDRKTSENRSERQRRLQPARSGHSKRTPVSEAMT